ncbi:response regulator [Nocardioides seonyuensis]|uniref:Response regulator n=1 Tax=Nocardioides seonyuensis TaxID=2518371 RepID=A0A4P7IB56_9ACTN|nr:response regulator [Nocardioides seonyuensis]QBX54239.1 response regulator [Nocardioides seonyuensis]
MAKIVVADDDADIRTMVGYRLQRAGHEVIPVADGAAALDACREHAPDLAVLDLMMPGLGGLDAARQIRADSTLRDVRILMLTARAQESDIEQGFAAGADDYLTKPFSPRELSTRVAALLGRGRA